jgi:acyl-CoA thioester hydrolase
MIPHAKAHAPLDIYATTVAGDWIDYNGHMNDAAYALVFSRSIDALMDRIGLDSAARHRTGRSLFTLQMMLHYFREAREGQSIAVSCRVIEHDEKRLRVWLELFDAEGERLAASEQLLMSVAMSEGRPQAAPWTFETQAALDALQKLHGGMPHPPEAGVGVGLTRKS